MRKAILTTMLISSLLMAGCGNNEAGNGGTAATPETGQAATASPEVTPEVTPEPAAEATAEPAPEATAQAPTQTTAPEATPKASAAAGDSQRQTYFDKLDKIEEGLGDLKAMSDSGVMTDMKEAASKEHERWDKALNEIYQELKVQLSEADMAKLKEEQLSWIKERDKAAEDAAAKYKGGTMEGLEYAATLASVTKERCYKLVELYMK
ncbi:lysozyme inhibitor LprI family protein [Paenibacillus sp. FSL H8-0122]|uniref:lysozyme inhibitor LprI family protein n=1 Tax=Paenibacillus sp. FSL H8-0122 TaxID=2954510 RepID=UPI0030FBF199